MYENIIIHQWIIFYACKYMANIFIVQIMKNLSTGGTTLLSGKTWNPSKYTTI